jgi:hypothetical protein
MKPKATEYELFKRRIVLTRSYWDDENDIPWEFGADKRCRGAHRANDQQRLVRALAQARRRQDRQWAYLDAGRK